ncbi:MAG: PAS domain-containing protein, partial [Alphaproteobacteria bacterium]|nr:PAS domain-containing protein [Alphaproteobacteria bacterium]
DLSPDAMIITSGDTIVFTNAAVVRVFAAENPQQLIGKSIFDFTAASPLAMVRRDIRIMILSIV